MAYPDHPWVLVRFKFAPKNVLKNPKEVKLFFEFAKSQLKITDYEDWYSISRHQIEAIGGTQKDSLKSLISEIEIVNFFNCRIFIGTQLLRVHGHLGNALKFAYPETQWVFGRFKNVPKKIWADKENIKEFLEYCKIKLYIESNEDWYRISNDQIAELGGKFLPTSFLC